MKHANPTTKSAIAAFLMVMFFASAPFVSLANNENKGSGNELKAKVELRTDLLKNNKNALGFWARFFGQKNNDPLVKAPVISAVTATSLRPHNATITWNTDVVASSQVWYAKTSPVSTSGKANASSRGNLLNHKVNLGKLEANTKYFVVVSSKNKGGATVSSEISFTTPVEDKTAPVITDIRSTVSVSGSVITWKTNEPTTSVIFYSKNTPITIRDAGTAYVFDNNLAVEHSLSISGLEANKLYHYIVGARDASGNASASAEVLFTTSLGT